MNKAKKIGKAKPFFIEVGDSEIHGDSLLSAGSNVSSPEALCIHDIGKGSNRDEFAVLRQLLLDRHSIGSCAFDFLGHGSSGGAWPESTLLSRSRQSAAVIDACFDCQPLTIIAIGSGAETVIELSASYPIANMILISPRVHRSELRQTLLGKQFDQMNSGTYHWNFSESLSIVEHFRGRLSIINNHLDEQSYPGMGTTIYQRAIRANKRQIIEFPSTKDSLLEDAGAIPGITSRLLEVISDIPDSVLHFFTNLAEVQKTPKVY